MTQASGQCSPSHTVSTVVGSRIAMLVTLLTLSSLTAPAAATTPGELLLDLHAQESFVRNHAPGFFRVHFRPNLARHVDPRFQPRHTTLGSYVQMETGAQVLVPTHRVTGIDKAEIELADGRRIKARFRVDEADAFSPFRVLVPDNESALQGIDPLKWSGQTKPLEGLMLWAIGWPTGQQLPNVKARPILVRTVLGPRVEPPLDRFLYVDIGRADGLALLTHEGRIQCLVFRAVPGTVGKSICSPQESVRHTQKPSGEMKNVP